MCVTTIRLASLLVTALTFSACAPMRVRSYAVPGARMSDRTYDWASAEAQSTGDPRLDNNPFFHARVQAAIERQLERRSFQRRDNPAVRLHYYVSVTEELSYGSSQPELDFQGGRPEVHEKGSLVIDLTDAVTGHLIWRGWAEADIDGMVNDQKWMEQTIDDAVARIMRRLDRLLSATGGGSDLTQHHVGGPGYKADPATHAAGPVGDE
jgi:hypothetical protein